MATKVSLIRKGSKGLQGTIVRSRHHAKMFLPFIEAMRGAVKHLGFEEWLEGAMVHEFRTKDGRRYTLRGVRKIGGNGDGEAEYYGIQLALRVSRSQEYPLTVIRSIDEMPNLLTMMRLLALPQDSDLVSDEEAA